MSKYIKNYNFIKWFKNSKIVDKLGKPLIVYHGSHEDFEQFMGDTYFTDDYFNADGYSNGNFVYEVYLRIINPLTIDCKSKKWDMIDTDYGKSTRDVVANVDRNIYDGIIFKNVKDSWIDDEDYQDVGTVYVTFKPNQIKSIENDGSWSLENNNIYL